MAHLDTTGADIAVCVGFVTGVVVVVVVLDSAQVAEDDDDEVSEGSRATRSQSASLMSACRSSNA